ncbi:MAG: hypothetical protein M3Z04_13660 [Chloroflexota bacterium]|nr:hypothetical protein [Chloroflexota bacterium]
MPPPITEIVEFSPVPTGIAGLDLVLRGGLLQGGIYIVAGQPGAGKTILGNQMAFHHVQTGGRAVYVTLLAETQARMLTHMRGLTFFDPAVVADSLYYISGYKALEDGGLRGLLDFLRRVIRTRKATLLVIDGLMTAQATAESDVAYKQFFHELQVYIETLGCTALLISTLAETTEARLEDTMVDGVIHLADRLIGQWAVREVEVRKLRGTDYLRGRHFYEIDSSGVVVHPRTEAVLQPQPTDSAPRTRLAFGVPRLDEMLFGGLLSHSTTLLLGPPGSGKTLLGLHFLAEGARQGERGLYFGFDEMSAQLISKAAGIGLDFAQYMSNGQIAFVWRSSLEEVVDALVEHLLAEVRRQGTQRLFIDSLTGFLDNVIYPDRIMRLFVALSNELRTLGVTLVFALETPQLFGGGSEGPSSGVSSRVDNILFLRYVELYSQLYRLISIVKIRESGYDSTIREFKITPQGLDVASTFASAEAILTGIARPSLGAPLSPPSAAASASGSTTP